MSCCFQIADVPFLVVTDNVGTSVVEGLCPLSFTTWFVVPSEISKSERMALMATFLTSGSVAMDIPRRDGINHRRSIFITSDWQWL